jgi:dTDP-4-amino-4,6-dideoxygalactose transaminase
VITNDDELAHKLSYMRNFGHNGPEQFFGFGINGKSSEFHAAMGLCVLPYIQAIIDSRKTISKAYTELLKDKLQMLQIREHTQYNYSYYPVLFSSEEQLLKAVKQLNAHQIYPRRYFYPSLNTLNYVENAPCPVSEDISKRVLCLPLFFGLPADDVRNIASIIQSNL